MEERSSSTLLEGRVVPRTVQSLTARISRQVARGSPHQVELAEPLRVAVSIEPAAEPFQAQ